MYKNSKKIIVNKEKNMENKLYFGTAGFGGLEYPSTNPTADACLEINKIGLDALEIEFVRQIYLKNNSQEKLLEIKKKAETNNIKLSIHAPYFINLNSKDKLKLQNSVTRIIDSLNIGQTIGANILVFHIGYFMGEDKKKVMENICEQIAYIQEKFNTKNKQIKLGPELTGKKTQIGSLEELFYLYDKFGKKFIFPVIDFAHQHARENGYFKNTKNIDLFFSQLKSYPEIFQNMHIHMSGINYTLKGERNHLMLENSDLPYKKILEKLKENKTNGVIICESPDNVGDALLMKKIYEKL